jgi:hypothetical protein
MAHALWKALPRPLPHVAMPPALPPALCLPAGVTSDGRAGVYVPRIPRDVLSSADARAWKALDAALLVCAVLWRRGCADVSPATQVPSMAAAVQLALLAQLDAPSCADVLRDLLAHRPVTVLRVRDECSRGAVGLCAMTAALAHAPSVLSSRPAVAAGVALPATAADFEPALPEHQEPDDTYGRFEPTRDSRGRGEGDGVYIGLYTVGAAYAPPAPPWDVLVACDALLDDVLQERGDVDAALRQLLEAFHAACDARRLACWRWVAPVHAVAQLRRIVLEGLEDCADALTCLQPETLRDAATATWLWLLRAAAAHGDALRRSAAVMFELAVRSRGGIDFEVLALWAVLGAVVATTAPNVARLAAAGEPAVTALPAHRAAAVRAAARSGASPEDLATLGRAAAQLALQLRRRALVAASSDAAAIIV